jgi:hypothetical protein
MFSHSAFEVLRNPAGFALSGPGFFRNRQRPWYGARPRRSRPQSLAQGRRSTRLSQRRLSQPGCAADRHPADAIGACKLPLSTYGGFPPRGLEFYRCRHRCCLAMWASMIWPSCTSSAAWPWTNLRKRRLPPETSAIKWFRRSRVMAAITLPARCRAGHRILHGIAQQNQENEIEGGHLSDFPFAAEADSQQHDGVNHRRARDDSHENVKPGKHCRPTGPK